MSLESTNAWTWADLTALMKARQDQPGYHIFSEPHLRGEIFNLRQGQALDTLTVDGNLLILSLAGLVSVNVGKDTRSLGPLCEIVLNPGTRFTLLAKSDATVHFIWSPPFAAARQDAGAGPKAGAA